MFVTPKNKSSLFLTDIRKSCGCRISPFAPLGGEINSTIHWGRWRLHLPATLLVSRVLSRATLASRPWIMPIVGIDFSIDEGRRGSTTLQNEWYHVFLEHVFTDGIVDIGPFQIPRQRQRFYLCAVLVCATTSVCNTCFWTRTASDALKVARNVRFAKFDHTKTTITEIVELAVCNIPHGQVIVHVKVCYTVITTFKFLLVFKTNRCVGCKVSPRVKSPLVNRGRCLRYWSRWC